MLQVKNDASRLNTAFQEKNKVFNHPAVSIYILTMTDFSSSKFPLHDSGEAHD